MHLIYLLTDPILDISKIDFRGNFGCQVQQLLGIVRLTKEEVEHIDYLLRDLADNFSRIWPGKCLICTRRREINGHMQI